MKIYDVIILGGGASGLMCGANLSKSIDYAIVEHNSHLARKIKISGGGRCNLSNKFVKSSNYRGDSALVEYALRDFSKEKLLRFFERSGVELELRKGRYYFCKNSSQEIIDVLYSANKNAEIVCNREIIEVKKEKNFFCIILENETRYAKNVVVATGAKSFQSVGGSEIGLSIAESFGIEVESFYPSLVGLTLQKEQFWMKELSGLSTYVKIEVEGKVIEEEMLFAHRGISGPAILSASLYYNRGTISINFFPDKKTFEHLSSSKKLVSSLMKLPKRLAKALLQAVNVEDKECKQLSQEERQRVKSLQKYTLSPAGNFGFTKAEVCRGGVLSYELHKETMESKKIEGLYFIGEVVDVTGELGGYNFQWAFSSGVVCAKALKKKLK